MPGPIYVQPAQSLPNHDPWRAQGTTFHEDTKKCSGEGKLCDVCLLQVRDEDVADEWGSLTLMAIMGSGGRGQVGGPNHQSHISCTDKAVISFDQHESVAMAT